MNKKIWIGIALAVLMVIGIATAALVKNLSNTVTATVGVTSPLEVVWTIEPVNAYAGDTLIFETEATNKANRAIDIYNQLTEITAPVGENWVGTEFDTISVDGVAVPLNCVFYVKSDGTLDAWSNIGTYNTNIARIWMDSDCDGILNTYSHGAGTTATSHVEADLNVAFATSSYTIEVCYLMDMSGSC